MRFAFATAAAAAAAASAAAAAAGLAGVSARAVAAAVLDRTVAVYDLVSSAAGPARAHVHSGPRPAVLVSALAVR